MKNGSAVSVIVPTLNEAENIANLVQRIDASLKDAQITYEIVVIDDHSSDKTLKIARKLATNYPVRSYLKRGKRGKAFSLLQGFEAANYPLVAMIDADLQYPPEELVPMHKLLQTTDADVIITRRHDSESSLLRKLSTKIYNFMFAQLLFGIDFDTQSGLKLFRKDILKSFSLSPSPWSFDLEFLVRSLENHYKIISHDIPFSKRVSGVTKVKLVSATAEMVKASLQLRWRTSAANIRSGHKANSKFLKQALPLSIITVFCALSLSSIFAQPVSAATTSTPTQKKTTTTSKPSGSLGSSSSVPASALNTIAKTISGANGGSKTTTPTNNSSDNSKPTGQVTTPATTSGQTTTPAATAATTPASQSQVVSSGSQSNSAAGSAAQTSSSTTTAAAYTSQAAATPASTDTSKLSAATGAGKDIYANTYPSYKLSANTTKQFTNIAKIAWISGAFCLSLAILFISARKKWAYRTNNIRRS